jgi:hypothetical protein
MSQVYYKKGGTCLKQLKRGRNELQAYITSTRRVERASTILNTYINVIQLLTKCWKCPENNFDK